VADLLPAVTFRPAVAWTCAGCGYESNAVALTIATEPDVVARMTAQLLAEQGRDALDPDEAPEFYVAPTRVRCAACGVWSRGEVA